MDFQPLASRQAALEILVSCLDKGQPLDEALARHAGFAGLVMVQRSAWRSKAR